MKKSLSFLSITSSIVLFGTIVVLSNKGISNKFFETKGDNYSLNFDGQEISDAVSSYEGETLSSVSTASGNLLDIKASNVVAYNSGWQTVLPNGYFYNPVNAYGNNNKISGITSIQFTSDGAHSLSLHYGYSLDNEEIIYTHKKTLSPNVNYVFNDEYPAYFYIKNDNNVNVNINNLTINYSCSDSGYSKRNYNVLMIGNSFADDTVFYSARVAASYGINLNIYDAYIAGCTINTHYTNLTQNNALYSMRSMNGGSWVYNDNMSLSAIINSRTWDVITFQQASAEIGRSTTYANLENLVDGVRDIVGPSPKFYWYQTWAYDHDYHDYYDYFSYFGNDQDAMFDAIIDCYDTQVEPLGLFDMLIPAGTAVQNLRTSYMKDTFTRDGKHMSSVHGRYLLALNFVSNVFDIDLDISDCSYLPPEANASFKLVAKEAIRNAYQTPKAVSNSIYTSLDIGAYDLSAYIEIDSELVGCSYWNSSDGSNYNKRNSNVSGTSNLYTSTKRFTEETLPLGSLVVIPEGFGVRPEYWVSDAQQANRAPETYQNLIVVDEDFFDGYLYRAFNIFKAGKTTLLGQYDQIFDNFHIYVPNASIGELKVKGANDKYDADKVLFKSSSLNIDSFDRLHLDPITGFYKCDSYYELTNSYVDDTAKKFMCTRPFYSANGDLPENTVIIVDSGYQWRSDCWGDHGTYSPRPGNITSTLSVLNSSFWSGFRRRTFNVSSTSSSYVGQNYISFMEHLRIYVPNTDDIYLPQEDMVTMTAIGYANLNNAAASLLGKDSIPILITLSGDDTERVKVEANGSDIGATSYSFNKDTGALSIETTGSVVGYEYGTLTGVVNRDAGTISNVAISGSASALTTNNGSITCSESWHDRCNYSTNAASQLVWQRWYMSGGWVANSGSGDWTTADSTHRLDNDYSMGLRIANSSYSQTRFTLKEDFNGGSGFTPKGISIWLFNPNDGIYNLFRIYVYTTASSTSGDHAVPSGSYSMIYETNSLVSNQWRNIKLGMDVGTIYNVSFFFQSTSAETTYVYLGHVSFY